MKIEEQVERVFSLYHRWGHIQYEGECVNQIEHALQAAQQAEEAGASIPVVLGALLHDVGHLVGKDKHTEENLSLKNHGEVGKYFLEKQGFPKEISDIAAGHVNAKRYLVYKNPSYHDRLSESSRQTLVLQGGPMTQEEAEAFELHPMFSSIIRVRQWDEGAKLEYMKTRRLEEYQKISVDYLKSREE